MIITFAVSLLLSSLTGYYALRAIGLQVEAFLLQICLSVGFGLGISSLVHFFIIFFTTERFIIIIVEVLFCLLLVGIVHYAKYLSHNVIKSPSLSVTPKMKSRQNILAFILLLILVIVFGSLIIFALQNPHGNWDAWAIWNLRARYLFRSGLNWQSNYALQNSWSHPDYPLFLPLIVVRIWHYMGEEATFASSFVSILFFLLTVMTIYASLTFFRGKLFGILGVLLLLGSINFINQGVAQYADIPLSLYFLLTWVLLALYSHEKSATIFVMVGFSVGLATWVKNEGLLFAIIFLCVFFMMSWLNKQYTQPSIKIALFSGFFAVFAFTLFFKLFLAPENDLTNEQNVAIILANLLDISRYKLIAGVFFRTSWNLLQVPFIVFPIISFFFGIEQQRLKQPLVGIVVITLLLMLGGYFLVYVNTPYDLEWHLKTSLARLFVQLWPSFVFITMFIVRGFEWNSTLRLSSESEVF